jgi:FKBP12-rapamycin complex-associated protein
MVLCQDTLEMLRAESLKNDGDQGDDQVLPYKLYLITLECEYMHKKNEKDIVEKVRSYFKFQDKQADNNTQESLLAGISSHSKVKAKTFFTLGSWVYERTESFTKENLEQINNLFDESL